MNVWFWGRYLVTATCLYFKVLAVAPNWGGLGFRFRVAGAFGPCLRREGGRGGYDSSHQDWGFQATISYLTVLSKRPNLNTFISRLDLHLYLGVTLRNPKPQVW